MSRGKPHSPSPYPSCYFCSSPAGLEQTCPPKPDPITFLLPCPSFSRSKPWLWPWPACAWGHWPEFITQFVVQGSSCYSLTCSLSVQLLMPWYGATDSRSPGEAPCDRPTGISHTGQVTLWEERRGCGKPEKNPAQWGNMSGGFLEVMLSGASKVK